MTFHKRGNEPSFETPATAYGDEGSMKGKPLTHRKPKRGGKRHGRRGGKRV